MQKKFKCTWLRVMGSSLPVGSPGRFPPRVRDENALLYISFHRPCSLSRSTDRSTGPPTASSSLAAASAFCRSSSLAARPLFSPETTLYNWPPQTFTKQVSLVQTHKTIVALKILLSANFIYKIDPTLRTVSCV